MDPVDRIFEAFRGRPQLAQDLRKRLAETIICGPWHSWSPRGDDRPPHWMRRDLDRFINIVAHVEPVQDCWKYLITCEPHRRILRADNSWVSGFATAELAMAAADETLLGTGRAILAPQGVEVQYDEQPHYR